MNVYYRFILLYIYKYMTLFILYIYALLDYNI